MLRARFEHTFNLLTSTSSTYYATESMLVLNPNTGQYDASSTPETGSRTLADHYRDLIQDT